MIIEKILFLILAFHGILKNPISIIPAGMIFLYIIGSEFLISKKDKEVIIKYIDDEIIKLNVSTKETDTNIQRLKDSIISLKMDRGIKSVTRS